MLKVENFFYFLFSILILLLRPLNVSASVGEAFGFGSRTSALVGSTVAWGAEAFSAYHNPAQLSLPTQERLNLSIGFLLMQPYFKSIDDVVTQNRHLDSNLESNSHSGSVSTDYQQTLGVELGFAYLLFPEFYQLTLGLIAFFPANHLISMDSGETYLPEYFLYRDRTQMPEVNLGVGANLGKGLHMGFGFRFGQSMQASGTMLVNQVGVSSARLSSDVRVKVMPPFLGFLWSPDALEKEKRFSLGCVFRFASSSSVEINSNGIVNPGLGGSTPINFNLSSISYYSPMALELGAAWKFASSWRVYGQLDYQLWRQFHSSITKMSAINEGAPFSIPAGSIPTFNFVNILIPRIAWEYEYTEKRVFRLGYAYRPSTMGELQGPGNYLDPPKHMLGAGMGLKINFLPLIQSCRLDFHIAYEYLLTQKIPRPDINEGIAVIGYPGYESGGNQYGGGMTATFTL